MRTLANTETLEAAVKEANSHLNSSDTIGRIRWACHQVQASAGLVATTSGGKTSRILPHLVREALGSYIPTIFIDTGFYFDRATYPFIAQMKKDGIDVKVYGSNMSPGMMEAMHGRLWEKGGNDFKEFLEIVKHEPLNRAFQELKPTIWVRGIMGYQTAERSETPILEYRRGLYRLHPIIDWTEEMANEYIRKNNLPVNPNHFDITKGEGGKMECGIGEKCGLNGEGI